ncbi:MAG: DUF3048 C-terminal domain-containing protein [Anaerolineae bacterium]|nr:DUF3048 C-terminal domain-containing protein [Anaerolineae bacterium]
MQKRILILTLLIVCLFVTSALPVSAAQPSAVPTPTATSMPVPGGDTGPVGPDEFPEGINPLTGLPVEQVDNLDLPPALVSITNFPITARPQAGLSYSPFVFEMYIGEGMTRFLAMFYGDMPSEEDASQGSSGVTVDYTVGPVRSGRLTYEPIRKLYGGFLVMASAWSGVSANLSEYTNVFGSDSSDINSAMIKVTDLEKIAEKNVDDLYGKANLNAYRFDSKTPSGGQAGSVVRMVWSYYNQVIWRYNTADGSYHRFQDDADAVNFIEATDRLNKEALTYENLVFLFANHTAKADTLIDVNLMYQDHQKALIFRDGKMYEVFWTTKSGQYEQTSGKLRPIRFVDAQGKPFALKPGQTWVHLLPVYTPYYETLDSQIYSDLGKEKPGSGVWALRFYASLMNKK